MSYEIRYSGFEDTTNQLPSQTTFQDYVEKNNLLAMKSVVMEPLPVIHFESFDFPRSPLKDGGYFSMAIRRVDAQP